MNELSVELAVTLAAALTMVFGAVLSIALERFAWLARLWSKIPKDWKPLTLLAVLLVFAPLPVGLKCAGAPAYITDVMAWIPPSMPCEWGSLLFAEIIGLVSWIASQATFFKLLNGGEKNVLL